MSKTEKMRGRLASIQRDREEFEKQKKELEADMNVGRNNMHKINKGLRNNAILEEQIVVDSHHGGSSSGAHATPHHSSKPSSERGAHSRGASFDQHASGTSSAAHSNSPLPPGANSSSNTLTGTGSATPSASGHFFLNGAGANAGAAGGNAAGSLLGIMPTGPRVSDWCYTAPLDSPAPPTVKSREMYENVRLLGRGSFGEVNLVKNVEDNKL
jgi:serine/threonine protein kinase